MSLDGKVALVTGAAQGIGAATAKRLAELGAKVVVADLDEAKGAKVVAEIAAAGGTASFFRNDVTSEDSVRDLVDFAVSTYGGLHLAHNNAGLGEPAAKVHEMEAAAWNRTFAVDVTGVFFCLKHEIAHMIEHGGGAIVNTASAAGRRPSPGFPAYTAAKYAVVGLTQYAALEYAGSGIRVNSISPGVINTRLLTGEGADEGTGAAAPGVAEMIGKVIPLGRVGQPAEVANLVAYLLSDDASYVTGEDIAIDAAMTLTMRGM
jgi:NAD(P)-dependent dehydrogenase (short-subunit alcohol dehydrogenase family)